MGCPRVKYKVIDQLKSNYPINRLCEILGVSRSGYYKWFKGLSSKRESREQRVAALIQEYQEKTRNTYGYRRITLWLNKKHNIGINHKSVLRIMNKYGFTSHIRRNNKVKGVREAIHTYENKLKRNFKVSAINQKWTTDITQMKGNNGTIYLSALKDLYDGSIPGHSYATNSRTPIILETIRQAYAKVNSNSKTEIILHSDQGAQYTSHEYHTYIEDLGITASMSKPGTPIDNAPIESFFSTLKVEWLPDTSHMSIEEIALDIDDYIEFYNEERIQLRMQMSPFDYRVLAA